MTSLLDAAAAAAADDDDDDDDDGEVKMRSALRRRSLIANQRL